MLREIIVSPVECYLGGHQHFLIRPSETNYGIDIFIHGIVRIDVKEVNIDALAQLEAELVDGLSAIELSDTVRPSVLELGDLGASRIDTRRDVILEPSALLTILTLHSVNVSCTINDGLQGEFAAHVEVRGEEILLAIRDNGLLGTETL